jgi:hypothetical protein
MGSLGFDFIEKRAGQHAAIDNHDRATTVTIIENQCSRMQ